MRWQTVAGWAVASMAWTLAGVSALFLVGVARAVLMRSDGSSAGASGRGEVLFHGEPDDVHTVKVQ